MRINRETRKGLGQGRSLPYSKVDQDDVSRRDDKEIPLSLTGGQ